MDDKRTVKLSSEAIRAIAEFLDEVDGNETALLDLLVPLTQCLQVGAVSKKMKYSSVSLAWLDVDSKPVKANEFH